MPGSRQHQHASLRGATWFPVGLCVPMAWPLALSSGTPDRIPSGASMVGMQPVPSRHGLAETPPFPDDGRCLLSGLGLGLGDRLVTMGRHINPWGSHLAPNGPT